MARRRRALRTMRTRERVLLAAGGARTTLHAGHPRVLNASYPHAPLHPVVARYGMVFELHSPQPPGWMKGAPVDSSGCVTAVPPKGMWLATVAAEVGRGQQGLMGSGAATPRAVSSLAAQPALHASTLTQPPCPRPHVRHPHQLGLDIRRVLEDNSDAVKGASRRVRTACRTRSARAHAPTLSRSPLPHPPCPPSGTNRLGWPAQRPKPAFVRRFRRVHKRQRRQQRWQWRQRWQRRQRRQRQHGASSRS